MNYEALLKKYVKYVDDCEGTDFVTESYRQHGSFTDDEWRVLEDIAKESRDFVATFY